MRFATWCILAFSTMILWGCSDTSSSENGSMPDSPAKEKPSENRNEPLQEIHVNTPPCNARVLEDGGLHVTYRIQLDRQGLWGARWLGGIRITAEGDGTTLYSSPISRSRPRRNTDGSDRAKPWAWISWSEKRGKLALELTIPKAIYQNRKTITLKAVGQVEFKLPPELQTKPGVTKVKQEQYCFVVPSIPTDLRQMILQGFADSTVDVPLNRIARYVDRQGRYRTRWSAVPLIRMDGVPYWNSSGTERHSLPSKKSVGPPDSDSRPKAPKYSSPRGGTGDWDYGFRKLRHLKNKTTIDILPRSPASASTRGFFTRDSMLVILGVGKMWVYDLALQRITRTVDTEIKDRPFRTINQVVTDLKSTRIAFIQRQEELKQGQLRILNATTGETVLSKPVPPKSYIQHAWIDNQVVLQVDREKQTNIYSLHTGALLKTIQSPANAVFRPVILSNGKWVRFQLPYAALFYSYKTGTPYRTYIYNLVRPNPSFVLEYDETGKLIDVFGDVCYEDVRKMLSPSP